MVPIDQMLKVKASATRVPIVEPQTNGQILFHGCRRDDIFGGMCLIINQLVKTG
jgi:hypothetical protein